MPRRPAKTRVAVLGGGFGSLSAVFAMTEEPGWSERYEITVYQLGWRLGGKARSGRDPDNHERSQGRGGQIWFGFYDNALGMMRRCYQELARPAGAPLATFKEAFAGGNALHLAGDGDAPSWPLAMPANDEVPGTGGPEPTMWSQIGQLLAWLIDSIPLLHERFPNYRELVGTWDRGAIRLLQDLIGRAQARGVPCYQGLDLEGELDWGAILPRAAAAGPTLDRSLDDEACQAWAAPLLFAADACLDRIVADAEHVLYPTFLGPLQVALVVARGVLADGLYTAGRGLRAINDEDLRAWLGRHGARPELCHHPLIGALYHAFFAFADGDAQRPSIAAGTAIQVLLRLFFTYRGTLYYVPRAGSGDAVFAPLYLLLRRRGVRFQFFHKVRDLEVAADEDAIDAITFGRQVALKRPRAPYEPLVAIKGLLCWPERPRWHQIILGHDPAVQAMDFESERSPEVETYTIRRGVDFDEVILGIPPGGLAEITRGLARRSPAWAAMLGGLKTAAVGGAQLWLHPTWEQLTGDPKPPLGGANFPAPFGRWGNASSLITYELWTGNHWPGSVVRLDAVIPEAAMQRAPDPEARARTAAQWLRAQGLRWLQQSTRRLWPDGTAGFSNCLDWNLLVDPERRMGEARLQAQHFWSASDGSDRQVLSLPGTERFRLRADRSGFSNLYLAGDWVDTGLNLACIESAVIAGMQAARALLGVDMGILGESLTAEIVALADDDEDPAAASSTALATARVLGSDDITAVVGRADVERSVEITIDDLSGAESSGRARLAHGR
ncbi:MAG: NAD(P)-binding protein [Nannocystaceae bacterium]